MEQIKKGRIQLWQFLLILLRDENNYSIIRWTDYSTREFKFIDKEEVARLWGLQKNRHNMNYDNLSRSLRTYYAKNILQKVPGERYVYQFMCDINFDKPIPNHLEERLKKVKQIVQTVFVLAKNDSVKRKFNDEDNLTNLSFKKPKKEITHKISTCFEINDIPQQSTPLRNHNCNINNSNSPFEYSSIQSTAKNSFSFFQPYSEIASPSIQNFTQNTYSTIISPNYTPNVSGFDSSYYYQYQNYNYTNYNQHYTPFSNSDYSSDSLTYSI